MIHEFFMEFGYDMILGVPTAYWLHERGQLTKTIGPLGSRAMYFFSPHHVEIDRPRHTGWEHAKMLSPTSIHERPIIMHPTWSLPPFQSHYAQPEPLRDKPVIVIFNKYATQWGSTTPNHLTLPMLRRLIVGLRDRYEIIYARYPVASDEGGILPWDDWKMVGGEFPEVTLLHEAIDVRDWNAEQFRLCANAHATVSVQGGVAIACSFFQGRNFIYATQCKEIHFDSFAWYYLIAGCDVHYIRSLPWEREYSGGAFHLTRISRNIETEFVDMVLTELL